MPYSEMGFQFVLKEIIDIQQFNLYLISLDLTYPIVSVFWYSDI